MLCPSYSQDASNQSIKKDRPAVCAAGRGLVAQWIERVPRKAMVAGSNPAEPTTFTTARGAREGAPFLL